MTTNIPLTSTLERLAEGVSSYEALAANLSTPPYYRTYIPKCGTRPVTAFIKFYADYVLTVFGCISNLLVVLILLRARALLKSVTGVFLFSLTVSDTLVLVTNQIDSQTRAPVENQMLSLSEDACLVLGVLRYASRFSATVIVLLISVNRFIVVTWPLRSHRMRRAKCAVIQVAVITCISPIASIYALGIGTSGCGCRAQDDYSYTLGVTIVDVVFCDILAAAAILVLSIWTIRIFRASGHVLTERHDSCVTEPRRQGERHMTVLLLTVAVSFVLLRLPYTVTWTPLWFLKKMTDANRDPSMQGTLSRLQDASNILYIFSMLNHAINLYLYCLCSKGFREEFWRAVNKKRRQSLPTNMKLNTGNTSPGRSRSNSAVVSNMITNT